ncbi:unnamed protein product [Pleuronectes platessa]|uniref:Uncharacterized protein n=1 Tax=Pleuronectes platessa TaxID=8262 RepID=A0A9N7V133_PLEPL|nr:unnamed protein product [Pleuronectes platessa]
MDFGKPLDATYDPDDSVTVLTESADVTMESSNPVHKTPTYIVYENCLLELFENKSAHTDIVRSYTVMDLRTNTIIDLQLVQVSNINSNV